MSKKKILARREQQRATQKKKRNIYIGIGIIAIVIMAGLLNWMQQIRSAQAEATFQPPNILTTPAITDGKTWGPADAPVVIQEFSDFQCPYCRRFTIGTSQQIIEKYGDSGQVRFEYNHYAFLGQESVQAAEAAECANEQGAFWDYHDTLFLNQNGENQGAFNDSNLKSFAARIGLDEQAFNACLDSGKYQEAVEASFANGVELGVKSTPSFIVNGELVNGALPFADFDQVIESALAAQ
ncbi:MAG: DsbA family protein [Anaerolineae bacterium]|nr:DsbA family protein [Anaerolineae bacterium]